MEGKNRNTVVDHRGISLLSVVGKILMRIILDRSRSVPVLQEQHGFRRANGTDAATFVTKRVMEEAKRCGVPLVVTFLDLAKAYDSIPRDLLWETMELYGFGPRAIGLCQKLYDDQVVIKLDGQLGKTAFSSSRGVRQGCLLSPFLFNLVMDRVLRTALPHIRGVPFNSTKQDGEIRPIKARAYADDIAIFSLTMASAQSDLDQMVRAFHLAGLSLNVKKTEYIRMPDNRTLKEPRLATQLPATIHTVGDEYSNAGAMYYIPPVRERNAKKLKCPFPDCDGVYKNDKTLRNHFQQRAHGITVAVIKADPTRAAVANIAIITLATGVVTYKCQDCAVAAYTSHAAANKHWKAVHEDNVEHKSFMATTGRPLPIHDTTGSREWASICEHNLGFPDDGDTQQHQHSLKVGNQQLSQVQKFKYLGRIVSDDNRDRAALTARINIATGTFNTLYRRVLCRQNLSRKTKLQVHSAIVTAQLLHGASTWTLTKAELGRLDRFQQRAYRNILGMNPTMDFAANHIRYPRADDVLRKADQPRLSDVVAHAQLRFYGHVLRRPEGDDAKFLLHAVIPGLPARHGTLSTTVDRMRHLAAEAGLDDAQADSRTGWRNKNSEKLLQRKRIAHAPRLGEGLRGQVA